MGKSSFLQDFKSFAMKGNVIDMAVGVIIGGAFGKLYLLWWQILSCRLSVYWWEV